MCRAFGAHIHDDGLPRPYSRGYSVPALRAWGRNFLSIQLHKDETLIVAWSLGEPAVNRPGRQPGEAKGMEMSAEGAAQKETPAK